MTEPTPTPRLSIGFILANRFTLSAYASFVDVLRLASDEGDRSRQILCRWRVLSPDMRPIDASCGNALIPNERLGDPARFDYLVVVGGLMGDHAQIDDVCLDYLKRAANEGVPLIGLCTGVFILYRAGLMSGYECCVSWFHHDDFLAQFGDMLPVSDRIFVVDRDRLTCSGGTSSAHLAAYLVEKHLGRTRARKSLSILITDDDRTGETAQPVMPHALRSSDELVRRTLLFMQQSSFAPMAVSAISRRLGVTRRTLERRFQASLGMTPAAADRLIRLEQAERLITEHRLSVSAAAAETGFCDASHFIRLYKRYRGRLPGNLRQAQPGEPGSM